MDFFAFSITSPHKGASLRFLSLQDVVLSIVQIMLQGDLFKIAKGISA